MSVYFTNKGGEPMKWVIMFVLLFGVSCSKSTEPDDTVVTTPDAPTHVYVQNYTYEGDNCTIHMQWSGEAEKWEYQYLVIENAVWSGMYTTVYTSECFITIDKDEEPYFRFRVRAANGNLKSAWVELK
jgi:hypothetical protein